MKNAIFVFFYQLIFYFIFFAYSSLEAQTHLKSGHITSNKATIKHKKKESFTKITYQNEVKLNMEHSFSATMDKIQLIINHSQKANNMLFYFEKPHIQYDSISLSAQKGESTDITKKITFYENIIIDQKTYNKKINLASHTEASKAAIDLKTHKVILTGKTNMPVKTTLIF